MAKKDTRAAAESQEAMSTGRPRGRADQVEHLVAAFAEQLGRVVGTIQARTEGWRDRKALSRQVGRVRDRAARLLEELARDEATTTAPKATTRVSRRPSATRSRGPVDAPGKKHRKMPPNPDVHLPGSQEAKLREARPMAKTKRHRARG